MKPPRFSLAIFTSDHQVEVVKAWERDRVTRQYLLPTMGGCLKGAVGCFEGVGSSGDFGGRGGSSVLRCLGTAGGTSETLVPFDGNDRASFFAGRDGASELLRLFAGDGRTSPFAGGDEKSETLPPFVGSVRVSFAEIGGLSFAGSGGSGSEGVELVELVEPVLGGFFRFTGIGGPSLEFLVLGSGGWRRGGGKREERKKEEGGRKKGGGREEEGRKGGVGRKREERGRRERL